jgi:hypothetical protein
MLAQAGAEGRRHGRQQIQAVATKNDKIAAKSPNGESYPETIGPG